MKGDVVQEERNCNIVKQRVNKFKLHISDKIIYTNFERNWHSPQNQESPRVVHVHLEGNAFFVHLRKKLTPNGMWMA